MFNASKYSKIWRHLVLRRCILQRNYQKAPFVVVFCMKKLLNKIFCLGNAKNIRRGPMFLIMKQLLNKTFFLVWRHSGWLIVLFLSQFEAQLMSLSHLKNWVFINSLHLTQSTQTKTWLALKVGTDRPKLSEVRQVFSSEADAVKYQPKFRPQCVIHQGSLTEGKGRISTIDLRVLTSMDQVLVFNFFTKQGKQATLMWRSTVLCLPLS